MLLRYPDGPTGVALLLLRLAASLILYPVFIALSDGHFNWWLAAIPSAILFFALLAGLGTRVAAGLLILMLAADLRTSAGETTFLLLASVGSVGALLLLGPGAYSIDAHHFGHRVIRLDARSPDRGTSE
jgi:hypothetical protein